MAIPEANWAAWSEPTIEPFMQAVIHFATGDAYIVDDDISSININGSMFESSNILFGPPVPTEASLNIVDFRQRYNPVLNSSLVAGIKIDVFLGLKRNVEDISLGDPQVIEWDDPQVTIYNGQEVWTTVFYTTQMLKPAAHYLLVYEYVLDSGERIEEQIQIPSDWFDRTIYAITHVEHVEVIEAQLYEILDAMQPYGVFFAREWSYDTSSHIATVDMVDRMNEALMLDNRADSLLPQTNRDMKSFLAWLLNLYMSSPSEQYSEVYTTRLKYSFYENTQAKTICDLVQACQAGYFFMPDGTAMLCSFDGAYDTDIIITDEDVISYNIQQTSAIAYDSIYVDVANVYLEQKEIINLPNLDLTNFFIIPFTEDRVFKVDYVHAASSDGSARWVYYEWFNNGLDYGSGRVWNLIQAYGSCVQANITTQKSEVGQLPYEISNNYYIQSIEHAQALIYNLREFMELQYNTIGMTVRGSYGLWPGAHVHVQSTLYNIDADYTVIQLDYTYAGSVSTDLVLQRRF